jgi:uncharacterized protein
VGPFRYVMGQTHKVDVGGLLAGSGQRLLVDDEIQLLPFEGMSFPGPARVHLEARSVDRELEITGSVDVTVQGECDACLEAVERSMQVEIEERLDPSVGREADPFGEGNVLTGGRLDVADLTQQVLLSALPLGLRCKEDCAGLCASCGTNLNTSVCSCNNGDHRGKPKMEDAAQ